MQKRSIPLWVFISVITCGIGAIIWFYQIAKEVISELKYESIDSPGLNLLFYIITFGTYKTWWNYKISTYLSSVERQKGMEPDFWAPVLSLVFGLILHQSRINRIVASQGK